MLFPFVFKGSLSGQKSGLSHKVVAVVVLSVLFVVLLLVSLQMCKNYRRVCNHLPKRNNYILI